MAQKPLCLLIGCSNRSSPTANTEIALRASAKGIGDLMEIKYYSLKFQYIPKETILKAKGIIFAIPVYFGNYSYLFSDFLYYLKSNKIELYPKVVGFISIGAKRNGGQETTIISAAWDIMEIGACVVNDGHPISQFGGTCVAGNKEMVLEDKEGLEMCRNLGRRVAETALILQEGTLKAKTIIRKWDTKKLGEGLFPCLACDKCPYPERKEDYGCIILDNMRNLHSWLLEADGIEPKGLSMRFVERTRYLRRDNYRLTYAVVKINDIRQIPIFIKENSILCRKYHKKYTSLIKSGRERVKTLTTIYEPIGYK